MKILIVPSYDSFGGTRTFFLKLLNIHKEAEIETPNQISLSRENVGGTIYEVGVLQKHILFPLERKFWMLTLQFLLLLRNSSLEKLNLHLNRYQKSNHRKGHIYLQKLNGLMMLLLVCTR